MRKIPGVNSLPDGELSAWVDASRVRDLSKGEIAVSQADISPDVFLLLRGVVRIFRINREGREQVLAYLKAGDLFNLPSAYGGTQEASAFAQAMTAAVLLVTPGVDFFSLSTSHPGLAAYVLRSMSRRLEHLADLVHDLSLLDVRSRLVRFLLDRHAEMDPSMRWTHEKIALQIGTSREVVSRILKLLISERWIEIDRGQLVIVDENALKRILER